jgi:hypothetical protein
MNLKIKLPSQTDIGSLTAELKTADKDLLELNLNLEDEDMKKLITPNTEKACFQLFHSIPTSSLIPAASTSSQTQMQQQQQVTAINSQIPSAHIFTNDQIFQMLGLNETDLAKIVYSPQIKKNQINQNPFLNEMSAHLKLNQPNNQTFKKEPTTVALNNNNIALDHGYTSACDSQKRKYSLCMDFDDNSQQSFSQDSYGSAFTNESSNQSKKRRTKGIYRAEDVTNVDEFYNYLERRKKNNISSKISRSNKKNLYHHMDQKADQFSDENKMLKGRISKLEHINETIKKELIEMVSGGK